MAKNIYIASDHRGFLLKSKLCAWLQETGHSVVDLGPSNEERCDAMTYALGVVRELKKDPKGLGILICGTGQAMAMTANRFQHIQAALCVNSTMARLARAHNGANVLALGAHIVGEEVAYDCLRAFLETPVEGGRYEERRDKLTELGGL